MLLKFAFSLLILKWLSYALCVLTVEVFFLAFSSSASQDNITSDCQLCMNVLFIKFKRLISFLMTHLLLQDWIQSCPDLISLGLLQSTSKNVSLLPSLN